MIKWFNKQKTITLGFIMGISCGVMVLILNSFMEGVIEWKITLKLSGAISILMFFMAWLLFSMGESSSKVFEEIELLYFRAKKAKTKEELIILETDYRLLRKKCQHQNHYYKMNEIWQVIDTKKELL